MRIFGGRVFGSDHKMHQKDLCFENGVVTKCSQNGEFDASGCYVIPGLIDTHIHGAMGVEFWLPDQDIKPSLDWLSKNGVTSILVTSSCQTPSELKQFAKKVKDTNDKRIVGIHAEGPFINPVRKGGMNELKIHSPDATIPEMINQACDGMLKIMTVAPELNGIENVINKCINMGVKVSMGHSDATYQQAQRAVNLGATRLTHTFNAIRPYNHREVGVLGCALDDERVNCELICDLYHVSAPAIKLVLKVKGYENVTMISDCCMFGGMDDGEYTLDGKTIYVRNGQCQLADGTICGSSKNLFDGAKNMFNLGFSPEQIAVMAAVNPAKAVGCNDRGELIEGFRADVLVVDSEFNLKAVFVEGKRV